MSPMFDEQAFIEKCYEYISQSSYNFETDDYEDLKPIITDAIDDICTNELTSDDLKMIVEKYYTEADLDEFKQPDGEMTEETYKNLAFDALSFNFNSTIFYGFIDNCISDCGTDVSNDDVDDVDPDDFMFPHDFLDGVV